jgi:hypothetical protein
MRPSLEERLSTLVITDENFLSNAKLWRELRKHRAHLKDLASRYPLMIDHQNVRYVLQGADEVDVLISDLRNKLKARWRTEYDGK